ncbi:hypothetical protein V5799_007399, partial [Amblyomma americanum]
MRAKLIGDAYYRDNDERFAWVGHDNWTYTRDFQRATFFLRVNGLPLFAKGSTWMPADAFPDHVTGERLESLLDAAAAAHMNLLRVWGGGLYESDLFYELADRRGLMVWQDFAFASALYPATPEFLDSVAREARQQ